MSHANTVSFLGVRGSVPVSGSSFLHYGGATTCVALRLGGQPIVLDAGTGLMELPRFLLPEEQRVPLLLSHPHADHLLGLPLCPSLMQPGFHLDIYASPRCGLTAEAQVQALMSPPLWPVGPDMLPATIHFHDLSSSRSLGPVQIDTMEGVHPGGVTLFRLTCREKRVVFLTDCTLTEELIPSLTEFSRDCDLLLCDGQYSETEWPCCSNFGHSTWHMAARFGTHCGAKQIRILHHDPTRIDTQLDAAAETLRSIHPQCTFACTGEEITL